MKMKRIILILLFAPLQSMEQEAAIPAWSEMFECKCPKHIPQCIFALLNPEETFKKPPSMRTIKKLLSLRPKATSHSFHVIMQLIARHFTENQGYIDSTLKSHLETYAPGGMYYVQLYAQLAQQFGAEKCLCRKFTHYNHINETFLTAIDHGNEIEAIKLLQQDGADPRQRVVRLSKCDSTKYEEIPLLNYVRHMSRPMPDLEKALERQLS